MTAEAPRRRPKQARSRATWEAIVEAASQILERHGPDGFNTNEVAERAGVSIGTLYQYFPDKHAILAAAARRELGQLDGRQQALVAALIAMVERLGRLGRPPRTARAGHRAAQPPRRTRPAPGWDERVLGDAQDWLITRLIGPEPVMRPIPIRRRR